MSSLHVQDEVLTPMLADPASFTRIGEAGAFWEDRLHRYYILDFGDHVGVCRQSDEVTYGTVSKDAWQSTVDTWLAWHSSLTPLEMRDRHLMFLVRHCP